MPGLMEKLGRRHKRETLTEAYEVRAFRDEMETREIIEPVYPEAPHPDPRSLQSAKAGARGHGEQRIVPDDCQFGDNDLCNPES